MSEQHRKRWRRREQSLPTTMTDITTILIVLRCVCGGGGGGDVYIYNWYPQMPYLSRSYNAEEVMFYVWFIWEW